ncbi:MULTISPECIES: hypothetical protein [Intestinimonas]
MRQALSLTEKDYIGLYLDETHQTLLF